MSSARLELEQMDARLRALERDVDTLAREDAAGDERPYLLPAGTAATREESSFTRSTTEFHSGTSIDTVSDRPTPEELVPRGISLETWCVSLTGTASLCGITPYSADASPYDPLAPQAWAGKYRKFRDRVLAGALNWRSGECSSCPDGLTGDGGGDYNYSGTFSVTCDDTEYGIVNGINYTTENCAVAGPFSFAIDSLYTAAFNLVAACPSDGSGGGATPVRDEHTLLTRTVTACGCYTASLSIYFETLGLATETLEEEVTFFDALEALLAAGGDVTEGESCCTEISAMNYLTPESTVPHTVTGTAGARYVNVAGGDPLTTYGVIITLERLVYNEVTEEYDTETQEVLFDVKGGTDTRYVVPITAPGEPGWCAISAALAA